MPTKIDTLKDLYIEQLRELYDAERQLVEVMPMLVSLAKDRRLTTTLHEHLGETRRQSERLQTVFEGLGVTPDGETCEAMEGLIREAEALLDRPTRAVIQDAGIIAVIRRVEHYEIAAYYTARTYARRLGRENDYDLFDESLIEEKSADRRLHEIAAASMERIDPVNEPVEPYESESNAPEKPYERTQAVDRVDPVEVEPIDVDSIERVEAKMAAV